ncbi:DMT family transporter [Chengkuizengella axinellae]|uniref:DMT family transporter n=1 Tax=Chengkuizengella axinellae TaxID=3064388 RepID=A0ABT9J1K7_9BACL|nr:DMT family transporter [Chengkuizengella sp. 2205SS18-9]MDP5275368.1 DMT family transporter [Chengkuizengella sp. 2205SS18-9]
MSFRNLMPYIYLTSAMFIVGSSIVIGKLMVQSIPVFLASGIRFGLASVLLFFLLFILEGGIPKLTKKQYLVLFLQSFTGVFLFSVCLLYGVQYTTALDSGVITSATPMVIALFSYMILKEKITRNILMGILFAVCGILAINLGSGESSANGYFPIWGNLLILVAVTGEAIFTILGKLLSNKLSPVAISTFVSFFGFLLFLPFSIYEAMKFDFIQPTMKDWFYVIYFAIIVTVLAFFLWYNGVSNVSGNVAGVFTAVLPLSTLLCSYLFLDEKLTLGHVMGMLLVIIGILYSTRMKKT